jgi:hypothetical protein
MMSRLRRRGAGALLFALVGGVSMLAFPSRLEAFEWWHALRRDPYPLDAVSRQVALPRKPARIDCSETALSRYAGSLVRYERAVHVAEPFQPKLTAFEEVVVDVARAYYGRPPKQVLHLGAFACRTVRGRSHRLSEHALGNAIDVRGFSFGAARRDDPVPEDFPAKLRRPFVVSVERHWAHSAEDGANAHHRDFLRALVARVRAEKIFRGIIGPGRPGHDNHFHFDYGPWSFAAYSRRSS